MTCNGNFSSWLSFVKTMSSILLEDETLTGKAVIERKKIEEFRIRSLAEVEGDLKVGTELPGWVAWPSD